MRLAVALAVTALPCALVAQDPATVRYEVGYDPVARGRVAIAMHVPTAAQVLVMPRAVPMGYADIPYDRYVSDLQATDADGKSLAVAKEDDGPRWRIAGAAATVRYVVDVDALERDILGASDTSKARPGYLGLLGYSVFAYAEGFEQRPIELTIKGPDDWPVFSTLAPRAPPDSGKTTVRATDFYDLADSQVIMGPDVEVRRFDAAIPLFVAQYAEAAADPEILGRVAVTALNALVKYFGSAPLAHYTVHLEFLEPRSPEHGYGFSMEHMASCTIFFDTSMVIGPDDDTRRHLYNLAHHIAHSWIPKRCAAKGYFPFSWELSPVLDSIWFSEGWGQYIAAVALAEEGGLGDEFRHTLVQRRFRDPLNGMPPFLNAMTTVEVSRIASTRYSDDFRTGRSVFARGGLMAFEIDEAIREATDGAKSLRDVVRRLMTEPQPLDLGRLPAICKDVTGVDVGEIYRRWLGPVR